MASVHSGSAVETGSLPSSRPRSWPASTPRKASGPPPSAITPGGTPLGSTPTENDVAPPASSTRSRASLPVSPPSGPNSSPATRTAPGPSPQRASSRKTQRAESDLSVSPISTCLTSLVTRGAGRPATSAEEWARAATSTSPAIPAGRQARFDRRQQLGDSRLRRVGPRGLGDEVDLASVQSPRHDLHPKASLPQPRGGDVRGNRERLLFRGRGHPAMEQNRAVASDREDLGAAVQAQVEAAGPLRPGSELRVDVVDIACRSRSRRRTPPARAARSPDGVRSRPRAGRARRCRPSRTPPPRSGAPAGRVAHPEQVEIHLGPRCDA